MSKSLVIAVSIWAAVFWGCTKHTEPKQVAKSDSTHIALAKSKINPKTIFFAGLIENKVGLFKYNFINKTYSKFWWKENEQVIDFLYSSSDTIAYMLTVSQSGKKGLFPFINNVKLYLVNINNESVMHIENLGSGLQVLSFWENDNLYKVIMNTMNSQKKGFIKQITRSYFANGKKNITEENSYSLMEAGFPNLPNLQAKLISPDKKYLLSLTQEIPYQLSLTDQAEKIVYDVLRDEKQKLNEIGWSEDGKYLVFSTIDISPMNETLYDSDPQTSKLFIYSLINKKILAVFNGGGVKNFRLVDNYLFFDNNFKEKSNLYIYNLSNCTMFDSIKTVGGCGMRNIPLIPDYEA
ncbi:MAG: hypothetical protein HXY50_11425 [Ignavibacteriaceae bacterium]|nr:hypothetical protein [Ignavibacteriaceae bacterium]